MDNRVHLPISLSPYLLFFFLFQLPLLWHSFRPLHIQPGRLGLQLVRRRFIAVSSREYYDGGGRRGQVKSDWWRDATWKRGSLGA